MRVHIVVMLYVLVFSLFFELSRGQYAVLLLTIAAVLAAEMVNTACEGLCDLVSTEYNPLIGRVKDIAAGAVLICAIFAVGVGAFLFWQPQVFVRIFWWFAERWWALVCLAASAVLSLLFIVLGSDGVRQKPERKEHRKKSGR